MSEDTKFRLGAILDENAAWLAKHGRLRTSLRPKSRKTLQMVRKHIAQRWGHIYVIPAREFVKIGVSLNPVFRWRSLSSGNPLIEPILYLSDNLQGAYPLEKRIHSELEAYRVVGNGCREWFKCDREFAVETTKRVILEGSL